PPVVLAGHAQPNPSDIAGIDARNVVFDDDGDVFITTTLADGSTRVTRIPGDAPATSRMMTLSDESVAPPSTLNVIYPEPEDTNPLVPEPFSSNTPGP